MIKKNSYSRFYVLFFASLTFIVSITACDNHSSSGSKHPPAGTLIEASKGGSVVCETDSGIKALLEIPAYALPEDTAVSINLISDSDNQLEFSITPEDLKLFKGASLKLSFGSLAQSYNGFALFDVTGENNLRPLKQKVADGRLTGTIYMFGNVSAVLPDDGLIFEISDSEKKTNLSSEWQELLTSFNALVWLGTYYNALGENNEAAECRLAAIRICKDGAGEFLKNTTAGSSSAYKNALEKLAYLMRLCDNPDNILDQIGEKYSGING